MKILFAKERRLRRIAELERDLRIWPPWHYMIIDMPYRWGFAVPSLNDINAPPRWYFA